MEKIQSETEYPQRIKGLIDDLRVSQNHCRELEERLRVEERNSKLNFERMLQLEEKNRKLKKTLNYGGVRKKEQIETDKPNEQEELRFRVGTLEREKEILQKSKETDAKKAV